MFDLEREIRKWRQEMAAAGLAPDVLIELEEHLREDIERQVDSGANGSEAFQAALQRIGKPSVLRSEFDLIGPAGVGETLRRHKWKLVLGFAFGLAAALVIPVVRPAPCQSEAKLFIRSAVMAVLDERAIVPGVGERFILSDAEHSKLMKIMNQQVGILTSPLLAQRVVEMFGPKKILNKAGGGEDFMRATALIQDSLEVRVSGNSNILRLTFRHPDSTVLQGVLREVIDQFRAMQAEVNRAADAQASIAGVSNIALIQSPSPPFANSAAIFRTQAMIVLAGVLVAMGWILVVKLKEVRLKLAR
jgi:uncharacterized protein involved in exopolysaccharide biosynthesis